MSRPSRLGPLFSMPKSYVSGQWLSNRCDPRTADCPVLPRLGECLEVVEALFETLRVDPLDHQGVRDPAQHTPWEHVVERRGQNGTAVPGGEFPSSIAGEHALHLKNLQLGGLVLEDRLGNRHRYSGRPDLESHSPAF